MQPCPRVQPCCSLLFRWLMNRINGARLRDADRLDPEELLDAELAALLAHARDANASEWALHPQVGRSVDQDLSRHQLLGDAKSAGKVRGLHVAREPIPSVVRDPNGILVAVER